MIRKTIPTPLSALNAITKKATHPSNHIAVTNPNSMTAAQRAFNTPELMFKILEEFVGDQREARPGNALGFSDLKYLQTGSLVNGHWFTHVMRIFWRNPTPPKNVPEALQGYLAASGPFQTSLLERFSAVQEDRRPVYANYVLEANLMAVLLDNMQEADILIRGFTFPELHTLRIYFDQTKGFVDLLLIESLNVLRIEVHLYKISHGRLRRVPTVGTADAAPTASSTRRFLAESFGFVSSSNFGGYCS